MAHLSDDAPIRNWATVDGPRRWLVSAAWTLMVGSSLAAWAVTAWSPEMLWPSRFTDALWAMAMALLVIWIAVHRTAAQDLRRTVEAIATLAFLLPLPIHLAMHGGASTMQWVVGAGSPLVFAMIGILDTFQVEGTIARRTRWVSWSVFALVLLLAAAGGIYLWWLEATCAFCI